jgi:magnesium-transporting ATPase (P-type)
MSVIVKDMNGLGHDGQESLYVLTKGADSIILPRLKEELSPDVKQTVDFVENYAKEGLRTLLLAQKRITLNEYLQWN